MKVYVRKWNADCKGWTQTERMMDAYDGMTFTRYPLNVAMGMELLHVTAIYMHASEPNTLCVYVEEVQG